MAGVESSTRRSKEKPLQKKPNAAHRKYSRFKDQLILKVVERDWQAVPRFVFEKELGGPWRRRRALPKQRHRQEEIKWPPEKASLNFVRQRKGEQSITAQIFKFH